MTTRELISKLSKLTLDSEVILETDDGDLVQIKDVKVEDVPQGDLPWLDDLSDEEMDKEITMNIITL